MVKRKAIRRFYFSMGRWRRGCVPWRCGPERCSQVWSVVGLPGSVVRWRLWSAPAYAHRAWGIGSGGIVAAVRADHLEALIGKIVPVEGGGRVLPFGGAFAAGGLEVDDPLAPAREEVGRDRHGTFDVASAPVLRVGTTPSGIGALYRLAMRRRWKAVPTASKVPAMRPTVAGGTARPGRGGGTSPTLRRDRPGTKPAGMTRSPPGRGAQISRARAVGRYRRVPGIPGLILPGSHGRRYRRVPLRRPHPPPLPGQRRHPPPSRPEWSRPGPGAPPAGNRCPNPCRRPGSSSPSRRPPVGGSLSSQSAAASG